MKWRNVATNLGAVAVFINSIYPGLDAMMIRDAFMDGSWLSHLINIGMVYYLYKDGKAVSVETMEARQ